MHYMYITYTLRTYVLHKTSKKNIRINIRENFGNRKNILYSTYIHNLTTEGDKTTRLVNLFNFKPEKRIYTKK